MNKLWLIIKREYLTRVTKKTFILATLLTPLGIGLLAFVSGYMATNSAKVDKSILVADFSGIIDESNLTSTYLKFAFSEEPIADLKTTYSEEGYDILLEIPAMEDIRLRNHQVNYYSGEKLSVATIESLERKIASAFREYKIDNSEIDRTMLDNLKIDIDLENGLVANDDGNTAGDKSSKFSSIVATGLSYIMGFLMYLVIFIFGSMVMRSVMEEKVNRIVEVMVSSVKPFILMLGKIIGVGMVGLTQLSIWMVLIPMIMISVNLFYGIDSGNNSEAVAQAQEIMAETQPDGGFDLAALFAEIRAMNWGLIIPVFVIFFLGGYFIYSSLFAAIGSAIGDDMGESQQFMLPIVIPVIFAFIMIPSVFNDPDGPVAVFGSMFPLFSPIIMPARLPFDPPIWQVIISTLILIGSVMLFVWLAGRVYRVGIFMYGKKVSFKELGKWLFYKG